MGKYWIVKIGVLLAALAGVIYLMQALRSPENELQRAFEQNIPAKIITQPPKPSVAPSGH